MRFAGHLGSATNSQGIRGSISETATLKFTCFLAKEILLNNTENSLSGDIFYTAVKISKKLPVLTKQAKVVLIKVKPCNAFLSMLLVCIRSYLKSVLKYKF